MNDITLSEPADIKKHNLTSRFLITGILAIIILVSALTLRGYYILRVTGIEGEGRRVNEELTKIVNLSLNDNSKNEQRQLRDLGEAIRAVAGLESSVLYGVDLEPIWPIDSPARLSVQETKFAKRYLANYEAKPQVMDDHFNQIDTWVDAALERKSKLPIFVKLEDRSGKTFSLVRVDYNFQAALSVARNYGFRLLLVAFAGSLLLFLALYYTFQSGIKTIKRQEKKLNQQIARLSNLLSSNKNMQKSMKTASARAVELNEQFLRRVGADLHDGPAQMIGFAVLRLNQVSKQEAAKMFGHEFHAVREALDESLNEIRGISSGLVLPELETLSLEECLRKVVILHGAKSKTEVAQYYQELPSDIPLPIKICAYRFIQEGLNNSHRHGEAKKCRLSAYVKNDELTISLKDNGIGFRKSKLKQGGAHLGLVGLKDRVESLGGKFSINSELGVGTALKVVINLADDE
jgi:signal transduction histidine kinase